MQDISLFMCFEWLKRA